jgi:hypothetical protein
MPSNSPNRSGMEASGYTIAVSTGQRGGEAAGGGVCFSLCRRTYNSVLMQLLNLASSTVARLEETIVA